MEQVERQPHYPRPVRGYALDAAAKLEAASPHFLLKLLFSSARLRQSFFAFAAESYLDRPRDFLDRVAQYAPDVLHGLEHLDPIAQVARALILMKPRRVIEALFGSCPDGYLGLLARLGCDPQYGKETYRAAFGLFADPRNRHRAKVLGQLPGRITAEHIAVMAGLDDVLLHRAVLERTKPAEVQALNTFAEMIADLCNATPETIKHSLDKLNVGTKGVGMDEWAQGWLGRQVRLPFDPPIPASDPDFKLCLGVELTSLGRRFRNCAGQRQSYTFLGERLIYEWIRPGETAVLELLRLTSGGETKWVCEDLLGRANRRVSPELAASVQAKLDQHGILYQSLTRPSVEKLAMHRLLDHTAPFAWDGRADDADDANGDADDANGDAAIEQMLGELEQKVHGQEVA
ncbi:hypothetical protein [uncultured Bosea sp.]|uniref:hypothetical protein n=1 Tax=uncultured Bosea sp. TaxID=211457 RepID=UPI0025FB1D13|nr:hypothetical protein [uncultured Bosea sp.]